MNFGSAPSEISEIFIRDGIYSLLGPAALRLVSENDRFRPNLLLIDSRGMSRVPRVSAGPQFYRISARIVLM